ncbi:MAG: OB-fold domain-containing protein [Propionibacteriaceae bacterium]|jgi:uncharacterized OB-fold protein|nr:OB-fold domain-containing protein [Propionibacteriaceae bacterium]
MTVENNLNPSLKNRPLPTIIQDTARFWESAREHAVELQKCDECGYWRFYPGPVCHSCGSFAYTWTPISGKGKIWTYTVLYRARGNAYQDDVPIAIGLIELEEGAILMSNIIDCQPEDLKIGLEVIIDYGAINDEVTLPLFRLA